MKVNIYSDHIAYTFEKQESIYTAGLKYIRKTHKNLMPAVETTYNDSVRLLYGIDELEPLREVIDKLKTSELINAIKEYVKSIRTIDQNDFLDVHAIDVNYSRLYYDTKSSRIKYVLLPVNREVDFHEGISWDECFRNTLLIILNIIFKQTPNCYTDVYYQIKNDSKTRDEIIDLVLFYQYDKKTEPVTAKKTGAAKEQIVKPKSLILEHNGTLGHIVFEVSKSSFVLGTESGVDGDLSMDRSISRKHCCIFFNGRSFSVEDLKSTNGTKINGYIIGSGTRYEIKDGDILTLADISFQVREI